MEFNIRVTDIPVTGQDFFCELSPRETEARLNSIPGDHLCFSAPMKAKLKLERTGKRVLVKGSVSAALHLVCSLCLEEMDVSISEDIFSAFSPIADTRYEGRVSDQDLVEEYYEEEEINLWPLIQEHLFLGIPVKPICRADCKGLCPVCGQNLNIKPCGCSLSAGHPGFIKLKQLRDSLPRK